MICNSEDFVVLADKTIKQFNKYLEDKKKNEKVYLDFETVRELREYILRNNNLPVVNKLKESIIEYVVNCLLDKKFIDILNNDSLLKFERIYILKDNLPLYTGFERQIVRELVGLPQNTVRYDKFIKECIQQFINPIMKIYNEKPIKEFYNFLDNNLAIIRGEKESYPETLEEAYDQYLQAFNNVFDLKYKQYKDNLDPKEKYILNEDEIRLKYQNKTLGNLGEMYFFDKVKNQTKAKFISKDYGNGYGYDIYYQSFEDNRLIENLIEVKTTTMDRHSEIIFLTENEHTVMNRIDNWSSFYYICRVFVDNLKRGSYNYSMLKYIGNDAFLDVVSGRKYYLSNTYKGNYIIDLAEENVKSYKKLNKKEF